MPTTIADLIFQELRDCIRESRALPVPLSLPRLAEHYRVSVTPVRQAVQALLEEGLLIRQANGRLAVAAPSGASRREPELGADAWARGPRAEEREDVQLAPGVTARDAAAPAWEAKLVEELLDRSLRGDADYLREEAVSRRCGVGRTMLRATFNRLVGEGLLVHVPRCGWRVRTFDEVDLRAYLVAREALELTALDLARENLDRADLEAMRDRNAPESEGVAARLNNDLHRYLIEKSGNRYIRDFFDRHGLYYAALFDYAAPEAHVISEMAEQHRTILEALLNQDWDAAYTALSNHIRAQYPIVKRLLTALAAPESNE